MCSLHALFHIVNNYGNDVFHYWQKSQLPVRMYFVFEQSKKYLLQLWIHLRNISGFFCLQSASRSYANAYRRTLTCSSVCLQRMHVCRGITYRLFVIPTRQTSGVRVRRWNINEYSHHYQQTRPRIFLAGRRCAGWESAGLMALQNTRLPDYCRST